jgi:hypothetical protein
MAEKAKYSGNTFHLKPGFEIHKRIDAAADEDAAMRALTEQERNFYNAYLDQIQAAVDEYERDTSVMDEAEYDAYLAKLPSENREMLRYEMKKKENEEKSKVIPTPEKVDAKIAAEKAIQDSLLDERTPEVSAWERFKLKSLMPVDKVGEALRKSRPDLDVVDTDDGVFVRRKGETQYKALDPSFKPTSLTEWDPEDVSDVIGDFAQGTAEGIGSGLGATGAALAALSNPVTAFTAPAAAIAGGVAGGGTTGGLISAGKQGIAKYLGYQDEIDPSEIKTEAALGGAFSLLPGGKTYFKGGKEAIGKLGKRTTFDQNLNKIKVPIGEEGAEKVLHPFKKVGEKTLDAMRGFSTGMNPRALELGRKHPEYITQVQRAAKDGFDPVILSVREMREEAAKQLKALEKYTYAKKEKLLDTDATVDTSQLRKELVGAYKAERKAQQKIYGKKVPDGAKEETKVLRSIYENLPRKTNQIDIKTADNIKRRINDIVEPNPNDPTDIKSAKIRASDFTKKFEKQIDDQVDHYKEANTQYAEVKKFEKFFKDQKLVEDSLTKVSRKPKTIEGLPPPKTYTEDEAQALINLTKPTPKLRTNLQELDDFTRQLNHENLIAKGKFSPKEVKQLEKGLKNSRGKIGPLGDIYEKKVALKQWLPKEKNAPVEGESRKGTLTSIMAGGGALTAASLTNPALVAPTLGYMAAMTPYGVLKQYQLGNALKTSKPLKAGLGLQPMRPIMGNAYETLRQEGNE